MNTLLYAKSANFSGSDTLFLGAQTIISATNQIREHRYTFAKHIHQSIEIYLITSGCCCMDITNQKIACKTGDFVLIPPNTVHSFYLETEDACTFRHIHFDPSLFSRWYLNQAEPYPLDFLTALIFSCTSHFHLPVDDTLSLLISKIIQQTEKGGLSNAALSTLHVAELMLHLINLANLDLSLMTDSNSRTPEYIRYVSYTLSYIHENYTEKILTQDIADHLNISSRYLSKLFSQHMNLTILNYINIYRINQAIELMTDPSLSLTSIASQVGLKDSQHFSKLFRSIIGLTPNRYRKLLLHDMSEAHALSRISRN